MRTVALPIARVATLVAVAAALGGCASTSNVPDRAPSWTKQTVAGSRIARQVDAFGAPDTGTMVQVITDRSLEEMPGNSLADKLNGGYSR